MTKAEFDTQCWYANMECYIDGDIYPIVRVNMADRTICIEDEDGELLKVPCKFVTKYEQAHEHFEFRNYLCPVCHGQGGFREQTGHDSYRNTTCDYCDGTGRVKAKVQVGWEPDYGT